MKRRVFISGSVVALLYGSSYEIEQTSAQVTSPKRIESPDVPTVSESNNIVIPILPYTIRAENLDTSSDIILTHQLVRVSDSSIIEEEKRSVSVDSNGVVSVPTPRVNIRSNGSNFSKSGTEVKLRINLDHSSISSDVSTESDVFRIVQSERELSSILIIPNGQRVSEYEGSYELARWEMGGSLVMGKGDAVTISKD